MLMSLLSFHLGRREITSIEYFKANSNNIYVCVCVRPCVCVCVSAGTRMCLHRWTESSGDQFRMIKGAKEGLYRQISQTKIEVLIVLKPCRRWRKDTT